MTVAYAALHQRLRYRGEDTNLYVAAFEDGRTFFSRLPPSIFDRQAKPMSSREVVPGSIVNIRYRVHRGLKLMEAVQVVREPMSDPPFEPVPDAGDP